MLPPTLTLLGVGADLFSDPWAAAMADDEKDARALSEKNKKGGSATGEPASRPPLPLGSAETKGRN